MAAYGNNLSLSYYYGIFRVWIKIKVTLELRQGLYL